jgi:putative exporter of polyketide antibiotics
MEKIYWSVVLFLLGAVSAFANIFGDMADAIEGQLRYQQELQYQRNVISAINNVGFTVGFNVVIAIIVLAIVITRNKKK